jgi:hypothetical protein
MGESMTTHQLFGDLYRILKSEADQRTCDRSFVGRVTLRLEDEVGEVWEQSIVYLPNTGSESEKRHHFEMNNWEAR